MCLLATKKKDRNIIVNAVLLCLIAINVAEVGVQWKIINICFIDNGDTILTAFISAIQLSESNLAFAATFLATMEYILADGLLVSMLLV